jgi:hypothetical protein
MRQASSPVSIFADYPPAEPILYVDVGERVTVGVAGGKRWGTLFQSSSASRVAAGATGFLTFIQQPARPPGYRDPRRFDTIPSQPSAQACL